MGFYSENSGAQGLIYQGTWDALLNIPSLTSSVGTQGEYYIVSVAGNTNLNGVTDWQIGDWAIFNGTVWQKIDNSDAIASVGLTMPSAFAVANSPLTSSGTIAVTGAGTASQYVRGDGQLATLPSGSSGGSSVNYYLNGSVAASVVGYQQMSNTAIIGAGTNFPLLGNGLIAEFLTDVANPNRLEIPVGAWNFEMYFNMSSSGGSPKFYVELLKYDGATFTSIASSSANPEGITNGTTTDLYLTSLAVPQTVLLASDRLAVRVYIVNNTVVRTATLHTENSNLCEIITTFAGGVSALNGLTANTQYFATGSSGVDFNISSLVDTHTFNLPTASAINRGALSSADWTTFNGKVGGTGTTNYVAKFTGASAVGDSVIYNSGTNVGIGTAAPTDPLHVVGSSTAGLFEGSTQGVVGLKLTGATTYSLLSNATGMIGFYRGSGSLHDFAIRTGNIGIGYPSSTTTYNFTLGFGNQAARTFGIEASATDVIGRRLTISAGSTVAGTSVSNVAGGDVVINAGLGTGTGTSNLFFQTGTTLGTGTTLQTLSTKMTILGSGNVGIGTITPDTKLHIVGTSGTTIKIVDGNQAVGRVLTCDAAGVGSWAAAASSGWGILGNAGTVAATNFIGTTDNIGFSFRVNNLKAGRIDVETTGNTYFGIKAGNVDAGLNFNTGIGLQALKSNTTGFLNVAIGYLAMSVNTTGAHNTTVGAGALENNSVSSRSTSIGYEANRYQGGGDNTAIGYRAAGVGFSGASIKNTSIGASALTNNEGNENTAVGYQAGSNVSTGINNTLIGSNTGLGITTGNRNTVIGATVTGLASGLSNNIILADGAGVVRLQFNNTGVLSLTGPTVTTVAATLPNRTIAITVGGTVYYVHAKTTND